MGFCEAWRVIMRKPGRCVQNKVRTSRNSRSRLTSPHAIETSERNKRKWHQYQEVSQKAVKEQPCRMVMDANQNLKNN
uniref:Uncharacterized protein n=1 Tax=Oryza nivara TaxID=4536 RepID=A0A0E0GIY6_ORYNI